MTRYTLFALWPMKPIRVEIESLFGLASNRIDATTLQVRVPEALDEQFIDWMLRSHITFEGVAE